MKVLVGADPECFVKLNGEFVSAHGLIPGDKKNPFPVSKGAVQVDGMALEFNISPASSADEFCINVEEVFAALKAMVPEYQVVATPVADFSAEHMAMQPAEALELGCDPDYNGWAQMANDKPNGDRLFRTASGHIHIGWTNGEDITNNLHFSRAAAVARQMDFFLGLPSLFWDDDTRRREMYGKAGCFRPKSYGCEYRTLSNAWLNSKTLMQRVYNNVQDGMARLLEGNLLDEKYGDIQQIINASDKQAAMQIIKNEGICLA
jgi:hypothetical protein